MPDMSEAGPSTRLPSHSSFTCFDVPAVLPSNTPRNHVSQRLQQQASPKPLCVFNARPKGSQQAVAAPISGQQMSLASTCEAQSGASSANPIVHGSHHQQLADQSSAKPVLPTHQEADAQEADARLPVLAALSSSGASDHSVLLNLTDGSPGTAGGGPNLASPATPSWQAGSPPIPLSSHPIDALDDSESATSPTDSSALSHDSARLVYSSGSSTPASLSQGPAGFAGLITTSDGQSTDQEPVYQQHQVLPELHMAQQRHHAVSAQTSTPRQGLRASSSLGSDAVILDFGSDLSAGSDGLFSPSSSVASWQRRLAKQVSDSSQEFTPQPGQSQSSAVHQAQDEYSPGSLLGSANTGSSGAVVTTPGLFPRFAPMFASSPLPGTWQQQQPASKGSLNTADITQPHCVEDTQISALMQYNEAAAQLQEAVAHATQMYKASLAAADARLGLHMQSEPASSGAHVRDLSFQVPCGQPQFPRQPSCMEPFAHPSHPSSSSQAAMWVPQTEMHSLASSSHTEGETDPPIQT